MEPSTTPVQSSNKTMLIVVIFLVILFACCLVGVGGFLLYQTFVQNKSALPDGIIPTPTEGPVGETVTPGNIGSDPYDIDFYDKLPSPESESTRIERVIRKGGAVIEFRVETAASGACSAYGASEEQYNLGNGFPINCYSNFVSESGMIYEAASPTYFSEIDSGSHIWQYDVKNGVYYSEQLTAEDATFGTMVTNNSQGVIFFPSINCSATINDCVYKVDVKTGKISSYEYPSYPIPASVTLLGAISINPAGNKVLLPYNNISDGEQGFNVIDFAGKSLEAKQTLTGTELYTYEWDGDKTVVVKDKNEDTVKSFTLTSN